MNQEPTLPPIKLMWGAFFAVPCALYFVLMQMSPDQATTLSTLPPVVIYSVLITASVFTWVMPRLLLQRKIDEHKSDAMPIAYYFPVFIIRMVMAEGIAVLGFALSFRSGDLQQYLLFAACSLGLTVLSFPSDQRIKDRRI